MLSRICCRLVLSKNTIKLPILKFNKTSQLSVRTITTKEPSSTLKSDHDRSVKIYHGVLKSQIRVVKAFSLSSSIIGLLAQPILYKEIVSTGNIPIIVASYFCVGFFTFITPLLLHIITKKYVTSMEYSAEDDKYIAHTYNFFCMQKKIEFKVEDVQIPEIPGMFTTMKVKGTPLFFDPSHFENPDHYAILMGFDKPMDFKMEEPNSYDKKKCK